MIKTNYGKFLSLSRTGMISALPFGVADGWLPLDGRTIGNATSGASARANADTQALYEMIWDNIANTFAIVSGGRGVSASADFAAGKTIALPDLRGAAIIAPDNMGGTPANRITAAGIGNNAQNVGQRIGANSVTLTASQVPAHTHTYTLSSTNPTHSHNLRSASSSDMNATGAGVTSGNYMPRLQFAASATDVSTVGVFPAHAHTVSLMNSVSTGLPHNNMMSSSLVYWMVKL